MIKKGIHFYRLKRLPYLNTQYYLPFTDEETGSHRDQ